MQVSIFHKHKLTVKISRLCCSTNVGLQLKNDSKTVTVQAIKEYSNSTGIDPLILDI